MRFVLRLRLLEMMLVWVIILFVGTGSGFAEEPQAPKFQGTALPVPPQQSQPWTAPETKLPPMAVSAITALFKDGLADPRGCDYREVEVLTGSSPTVKTHGWMMPEVAGQKFAVCWNGLVYPVVTVGNPANLQQDIAALLEKDRQEYEKEKGQHEIQEKQRKEQIEQQGGKYTPMPLVIGRFASAIPNSTSLRTEDMASVKVALLLRLGKVDLAEAVWTQLCAGYGINATDDPYLNLAGDLAWAQWDRAVSAHINGDDHLALASAQALALLQQAIETEAATRGLPRPVTGNSRDNSVPYLDFLQQLPALIADEQIRLQEPPHTPVLSSAPQLQGAEKVAGLIRDLELESAQQMGFPGGVNLMDDSIVQALVQEGNPAVEPLIKCLEEDVRLTRSVSMFRPWVRNQRTILPVAAAAYLALCNILHTTEFGAVPEETLSSAENRKALGEKIRAYWQQNKGITLQDRWYQTLSDSKAAPTQWREAALGIVQDSDMDLPPSGMNGGWTRVPIRQPGVIPAMRGESLRAKSNPSISDLLVQRMNDLSAPMHQYPDTNLRMKTDLGLALAKWDGKAHLAELQALSDILKSKFVGSNPNSMGDTKALLDLYQARIRAGDPLALSDYAAWLSTVQLKGPLLFATPMLFEIMWQHPAEPAIDQAAEKLFAANDSPWVPLVNESSILINSPLVGLAAFRTELLRGLADKSPVGTVKLDKDNYISLTFTKDGSSGSGTYLGDPLAPPAGTVMPLRICDYYAYAISFIEGAPKCQPYWPEDKKDEAEKVLAAFLQKYGDLYQYQSGDSNGMGQFNKKALIHFPQLDHPATQDDVDHNRAIFSLGGESRLYKLPTFPLSASWTTLKDNPGQGSQANNHGPDNSISYMTAGKIFQAEETLVDGKWERFYGFVGPYHIAKVPASEIELQIEPRWWWWLAAPGFEGKVEGPGEIAMSGTMGIVLPTVNAGDPVPVSLKYRNIRGVDQVLPASLTPPTSDGKTFPAGVLLTLFFTEGKLSLGGPGSNAPEPEWTEVHAKSRPAASPAPASGSPAQPVGAGQDITVTSVDLRDFFDVSRPGTYRLHRSVGPADTDNSPHDLAHDAYFQVAEKPK